MFENLSIEALQNYWWVIDAILGSALVFLMFVQGGQSLLLTVPKTAEEKTLVVNAIGRKWEYTFTTLVVFGGAFFASFPLFYSTSFGGAYWVWVLILFSFIIQAVSYEFRSKIGNFLGARTYEMFLSVNGIVAPLLIGAAVGTFFTGSSFFVSEMNLSQWMTPTHGLEAAFNITNLSLGLAILLLSRILGAQYFIHFIKHDNLRIQAQRSVKREAIPFVVLVVLFLILVVTKDGFAVDPTTGTVNYEAFKYLHNLLAMPLIIVSLLAGVLLVLWGIIATIFIAKPSAFWLTGGGAFLVAFSLFMIAGFNNTSYYPSVYDLQSSLTIRNSSSSHYTLTAMSYVSLFVPVVVLYMWYAWKQMDKKKLDAAELQQTEGHVY